MKSPSILLRVMLSIALVLNGIGSAMASTQMATAVKVASADAGSSGHPMPRDTAAAATPHGAHHVAPGADAPGSGCHDDANDAVGDTGMGGGHGVDCCQAGMCSCHCMQLTQVTLVPPASASPQVAHSASVRAMGPARESPRLPHLIRPPIFQAS